MLTVTDSALDQLANAMSQIDDAKPEDACFRIVPADNGKMQLAIDKPDSHDETFERAGKTVLVVAKDVSEQCEGRTLDADVTGNLVLA